MKVKRQDIPWSYLVTDGTLRTVYTITIVDLYLHKTYDTVLTKHYYRPRRAKVIISQACVTSTLGGGGGGQPGTRSQHLPPWTTPPYLPPPPLCTAPPSPSPPLDNTSLPPSGQHLPLWTTPPPWTTPPSPPLWTTPPPLPRIMRRRAVRILLECILVCFHFHAVFERPVTK